MKKILVIIVILVLLLLSACSPRYIEKVDKQTDTLYYTKYLRDSVYLHDSVSVSICASNDTVYVNRFKSTIKYKERLKTDTLRQVKQVTKTDTKVVELKKKNSWFSPFVYGLLCGGLLLLILQSRNGKMK